jgi:hypothetical protein
VLIALKLTRLTKDSRKRPVGTFYTALFFTGISLVVSGSTLWGCGLYGTIEIPSDRGCVYVFLVTERDMSVPGTGASCRIIEPVPFADHVRYQFTETPEGTYALRIFQDSNGNGKLDFSITGPSEPWALTWSGKKRGIPRFRDISFRLTGVKEMNFVLE